MINPQPLTTQKSWLAIRRRSPEAQVGKDLSEWAYYADVDEIFHAKWSARRLARFKVVREAIHHFWPEGYPVDLIQVAGTSGKGSTSRFIQAGLSSYGKSGAYLKPHVFDFAERFIVNGKPVGHSEIARAWEEVRPYAVESALRGEAWELDHFEASLLLALKIFERRGLRWAVVETGMGGRYDPVTALDVVATVVTNVGEDHEEALGSEQWQRALEKAGVCRNGIPLFSGDLDRISDGVLRGICRDMGAPLHRLTPGEIGAVRKMVASEGKGGPDELLGSEHQMVNAALAVSVVGHLVGGTDLRRLVRSFLAASYVGRFWRIEKDVYADVAHNPSKTRALAEELKRKFPRRKKVFVIGISGSRDPSAVMAPLIPQARAIVVTAAGFKGQDPDKVYARLRDSFPRTPIHLALNPLTTLSVAKKLRAESEVIVFTGSTYMVDQALNKDDHLRHLNASVGWREMPRVSGSAPPEAGR